MASLPSIRADRARLAALAPEERQALYEAWRLAPFVAASVRLRGYRRTRRWVQRWADRRPGPLLGGSVEATLASAVRLADAALRRQPLPATCVPRSVLVWGLLRRHGVASEVVIGVRRSDGPGVDAHAWVEHEGRPITDPQATVDRFLRLDPDPS